MMTIKRIKFCFVCALVIAGMQVHAQKVAPDAKLGEIVIKGIIGNINPPAKIWIYIGNEAWDTIPVKDGKIEYRKKTMLPAYGAIQVKYNPNTGSFKDMDLMSTFFDVGEMHILSNTDSIKTARFSGSGASLHNKHLVFYQKEAELVGRQRVIAAELNSADPKNLQSDSFMAEYERRMARVDDQRDSLLESQILTHPGSLVSYVAMLSYLKRRENNLDTAKALRFLNHFADIYRDRPSFKNIIQKLSSPVNPKQVVVVADNAKADGMPAVGSMAPAFSQATGSGKPVALKDFQGKYVLIDFWASWCRPCRKVNPELVSVFDKFKNQNFTILGVSLDHNKAAWETAIMEDKLYWPQVSDLKGGKNEVAQTYGVTFIPQNVLVDPRGKIVAKNLNSAQLETKLRELTKKI